MVFVKLALIFLVIILLLTLKRPLWQALLGGLTATALFYRIPPLQMARLAGNVVTVWSSLQVLLSLYLITFLQRILEARSQIRLYAGSGRNRKSRADRSTRPTGEGPPPPG